MRPLPVSGAPLAGQLVIVHRSPGHNPELSEWIYNRAGIDSAKVIWARDMGPAKNEQLIRYFKHRHVWLLYAGGRPPKLRPYPKTAGDGHAVAEFPG